MPEAGKVRYTVKAVSAMGETSEAGTGTEITVSFDADPANLSLLGEHIYYLNTDELKTSLDVLREGGLTNLSYDNSHIQAEVTAAADGALFTSIPYDEGFTVKVDGKKVDYRSMNGMFLMFDVPAGRHDVEISYLSKGFLPGLAISILSLIGLIAYALISKKHSR